MATLTQPNDPSASGSPATATPRTGSPAGAHAAGSASPFEAAIAEAAALPLLIARGLGKLLLLSPLAIVIALLAVVGWWYEHGAHLRQADELRDLKKQTEAQVSKLQADAEAATRQANQTNAQQIIDLEAQRNSLEKNAETLRQQLALLGEEERSQVEQVATLPAPEVAHNVANALGLGPNDLGAAGAGSRVETTGPQSASTQGTGDRGQGTGDRGQGTGNTGQGTGNRGQGTGNRGQGTGDRGQGTGDRGQETALGADRGAASSDPTYELSDEGMRKINTALVELDSCHKQAAIRDQEVSNCQQQAAANQAIIAEQKASIDKLNSALADKDQILAREQQSSKEQMKIVRGTFVERAVHVAEHVAFGVAIGIAIRH